jgi:trk system potassium uptake protein TrkH
MHIVLRILPTFGLVLLVFSGAFLVPQLIALIGEDGGQQDFWLPLCLTLMSGLICLLPAIQHRGMPELKPRDGILLVVLCWTVIPAFAAMPLYLHFSAGPQPTSWSFAYFEAVSGLTTTGATVFVGLDQLPYSINFWRCFLQWLGGMGILILAVAILPLVSAGAGSIFKAESTGPLKESKLTPRIAETAKGLWGVYCLISLACLLAYWAGGMPIQDAWLHMFSTMSLGGLSSHDASFGFFQSPLLEWIAVIFMLIASGSFALYFVALIKRKPLMIFTDPEWRGTIALLLLCSLGIAVLLVVRGVYTDPLEALRYATFNTVSIGSTTGYSTTDYNQWPVFAPVLMLLLSGVATSAGSTGAGIKMARLVILMKQTRREIHRMLHPRSVNPLTVNGEMVSNGTIFSVLAFMLVYGGTVLLFTFVLLLTDLPLDTAFSAVVACVNNMGPGLNEIGPAGNYSSFTSFQANVCSVAMILGRLEMMSFLAIFSFEYWKD